jgi:HK97 family phage portal protein
MAWNSRQTKDLASGSPDMKAASLSPGAPVAYNTAVAGKPYRDSWDIERAYREGMQRVVWVSRCIDAISGNQARLPMILRDNNSPVGQVIDKDNSILDILNTKSNPAENSFVFRYRLSSQLLMSSRGVFIEKVRGRDGRIIALQLLPPQSTAPIPDPKTFVSGFEVSLSQGKTVRLKPEDVIWLRRPHPLDPYLSMTPMESAGIAIEIENLARVYNRNFLLNDGRPGGLLVVRGEIDDDDKDELRSRFRGNLNKAGAVSVIAADDGVDFVDTGSNPRDAAYAQMRQLTKEEILASFGVPESVIGNAAGRTFSNAAEELRVFWMETMLPHLEPIARGLDELDPQYYLDFDTSTVPILIISKQERQRYLMDEFQQGLISVNEFREQTGRNKVESEIADQLLSNPNLVPIANTEKPFAVEEQQPVAAGGAVPAGPEGAAPEQGAPAESAPAGAPGEQQPAAPEEGVVAAVEPVPEGQLSASGHGSYATKMNTQALSDWDSKSDKATERWTDIIDRAFERLFERQQRVVIEKAMGVKARRAMADGSLTVDQIFDLDVWDRQLKDDLEPLFRAVLEESVGLISEESGMDATPDADEVKEYLDNQVARSQKVNESTREEVAAALIVAMALTADSDEDRSSLLRAAITAIFANLLGKRKRIAAEHETQTAMNAGTYFGSRMIGAPTKTWKTRKDARVRQAHSLLDNKTVGIADGFAAGDTVLRFPGDPLAPPHLTINCRCKLNFDS